MFFLPFGHRHSGGVTSEEDVSLILSAWFVQRNAEIEAYLSALRLTQKYKRDL